ncbi:MAG: hypothetical protein K2P77_11310, partial [Burkholderiaceae bacterium]|nr:hypothetical protein [Burkholderiaceae bacterium]
RSLLGWIRDIGANLLVNIVTILVIGAIVIGYKSVGQIQHHAETTLGMQPTEPPPRVTPPTPSTGH